MTLRWWRICVRFPRDGAPHTQTFHVRARTERNALGLVQGAMGGAAYEVYVCHPSDPMPQAPQVEEIAATYGPWRRSWDDPVFTTALEAAESADRSPQGRGDAEHE
jgi:hypothetical protein